MAGIPPTSGINNLNVSPTPPGGNYIAPPVASNAGFDWNSALANMGSLALPGQAIDYLSTAGIPQEPTSAAPPGSAEYSVDQIMARWGPGGTGTNTNWDSLPSAMGAGAWEFGDNPLASQGYQSALSQQSQQLMANPLPPPLLGANAAAGMGINYNDWLQRSGYDPNSVAGQYYSPQQTASMAPYQAILGQNLGFNNNSGYWGMPQGAPGMSGLSGILGQLAQAIMGGGSGLFGGFSNTPYANYPTDVTPTAGSTAQALNPAPPYPANLNTIQQQVPQ